MILSPVFFENGGVDDASAATTTRLSGAAFADVARLYADEANGKPIEAIAEEEAGGETENAEATKTMILSTLAFFLHRRADEKSAGALAQLIGKLPRNKRSTELSEEDLKLALDRLSEFFASLGGSEKALAKLREALESEGVASAVFAGENAAIEFRLERNEDGAITLAISNAPDLERAELEGTTADGFPKSASLDVVTKEELEAGAERASKTNRAEAPNQFNRAYASEKSGPEIVSTSRLTKELLAYAKGDKNEPISFRVDNGVSGTVGATKSIDANGATILEVAVEDPALKRALSEKLAALVNEASEGDAKKTKIEITLTPNASERLKNLVKADEPAPKTASVADEKADAAKPASDKPTPNADAAKPASDKPTPNSDAAKPASDKPTPNAADAKPASDKPTPNAGAAKPASDKPTPNADAAKPASDKPTPNAADGKPASDKPTPNADAAKPASDKPTPKAADGKPASDKPTPNADAAKPASDKPTEKVEKKKPEENATAAKDETSDKAAKETKPRKKVAGVRLKYGDDATKVKNVVVEEEKVAEKKANAKSANAERAEKTATATATTNERNDANAAKRASGESSTRLGEAATEKSDDAGREGGERGGEDRRQFGDATGRATTAPKSATFRTPLSQAPADRAVKQAELIKEISKFIEKRDRNSLTVKVEPEALGKVRITVETIKNALTTRIEVETEAAKQLVERNIHQLTQQAAQSGTPIQSVQVSVGGEGKPFAKQTSDKKRDGGSSESDDGGEERVEEEPRAERKLGYNTYEYTA
jgi:hypothetical protein